MRNRIITVTLCCCLWVLSIQGVKWFGPNSKYMCHCEDDQCDVSGQCVNGSKCARGWFGIKCQYVDLASGLSDVLTDGDDSTCTSDTDIAIVDLREKFPFTWLRLVVIDPEASKQLKVSFHDYQNHGTPSVIQCSGMKLSYINNKTLDIRCDLSVMVNQVIVSGGGVKSLCSIYISGGRNVALHQATTQSSTYMAGSSNGVDGYSMSCTHTEHTTDLTPSWNVTLSPPQDVNRYRIYNRYESSTLTSSGICCPERLQKFKLQSYSSSGGTLFTYQEPGTIEIIYNISTATLQEGVSKVQISTTIRTLNFGPILTLCEVEIYGECPVGTWGLTCENNCSKNCYETSCHRETGECDNGCQGFEDPPECTNACSDGNYGHNCQEMCPARCQEVKCQTDTGYCYSCKPGYRGNRCEQNCNSGYWGVDCNQKCSSHCAGPTCNGQSSHCDHGCQAGYQLPNCTQVCEKGHHGINCTQTCSPFCLDRDCDPVTGDCIRCKPGFQGHTCHEECGHTYYGMGCTQRCPDHCAEQLCYPENGHCIVCEDGWTGDQCQISLDVVIG
ncbi:uncharacterized protein LOC131953048 [Physella acuta]|uniref:uncharacterized protein LOC131953048 n=1 Tax=Physella acuta TaxID=109671 RepID=UPI0027DC7825|nr:uncharacterized protein LOC131953048 [Physella acuta]